jgi:transposase
MNLREIKGKQIALTRTIKKLDDGFAVQSQNSKKFYFVDNKGVCNCPDCQSRQVKCKHSFAVQYFLQKVTIKKGGAITVQTKRLTYPQAWHAYNQAQNSEVNMFDKLLRDLVESINEPEPKQGAGRPNLSLREQLFCSTQKVYSQLSSRRAKSLFNNAKDKGFLGKAPHSNAVNKFFNRKDITPIFHKLIALSSAPLKSIETKFATDSSGFRTTKFSEYCNEKHNDKKRHHEWIKAHICTGTKTNIITSAIITPEYGADSPQFIPLAQTTADNGFNISEMLADKAYNSISNYNAIQELGGTAYIPYKSNTTALCHTGNKARLWRKMFHYYQLNQEDFLNHYHARSNVESTMNMLKSKFGDSVKSKNWIAQQNEMLAKILCHNIVVVIHEMFELGIETKFKDF